MTRAYGLIRSDLSGDHLIAHSADLRLLAARRRLTLSGMCVQADDHWALLVSTFRDSGIEFVLVPSLAHIGGWLDAIRCYSTVVTLSPPRDYRRHEPKRNRKRVKGTRT